ncbi:translation factor GUF1 homolog, mitochondrial isoform X2 [Prorops nasuta]|uniref:translation factor GUF1 homolog, mitochondrial isoform X2 n=1 Tax=Prorops nasuta TaxID=863751 RepID=UPI0034CFA783
MTFIVCNFRNINLKFFINQTHFVKQTRNKTNHKFYKNYCSRAGDYKDYPISLEYIRNFSIIAHVDHGKSTLADRILEVTGAIKENSGAQVLDKLQVEKERGITVKAQTASLRYVYKAPCQGVILLVDANDGVQAQTVANYHLASERNLKIIPVINKIDLKNADPMKVTNQLKSVFNIDSTEILKISAKLGIGIREVLNSIVERIPPPNGSRDEPLKALLFDCWYDKYKGSIMLIYLNDGTLSVSDSITSIYTKKSYEVKSLMLLRPQEEYVSKLYAGQVGCVICNLRSSKEAHIGDTFHLAKKPVEPLVGFRPAKPMVFAGFYPMDQSCYMDLQKAIERLTVNDSSVDVVSESSPALGQGWRIGFLGLLHMEVFQQRLEQEYGAEPVVTAPSVTYKAEIIGSKYIKKYKDSTIFFNNPAYFPDKMYIKELYEPMIIGTIIAPAEYIGDVIALCLNRRGVEQSTKYLDNDRVILEFLLPLNEVVLDFHDKLKSITSGYASFDYEENDYQQSNIVKIDIALNGNVIEELCTIAHCTNATEYGRKICEKLVGILPRQQFEIIIHAKIGSKILCKEILKPYRKDVTAKLYGGDITRRKKLLAQQAEVLGCPGVGIHTRPETSDISNSGIFIASFSYDNDVKVWSVQYFQLRRYKFKLAYQK